MIVIWVINIFLLVDEKLYIPYHAQVIIKVSEYKQFARLLGTYLTFGNLAICVM